MRFNFATEAEISQELGKRIAQQRIQKNITQADLAKRAGVGVATLQRLEKGEGSSLSVFIRVLTALGFVNDLADILAKKNLSIQEFEALNTPEPRQRASKPRK
ncbi:helix-turn-helix transcriptional regulator [Pseudomonas sp. F1_0610]|uniref:helix-turn-helix domain-containing protein n=1 Tax=Pseudomonas sp. F1_0610 TaxID=3114284 RepID=UPI0039C11DCF